MTQGQGKGKERQVSKPFLAPTAHEPDYRQKCYQFFQDLFHVIPPNFDLIIANVLHYLV